MESYQFDAAIRRGVPLDAEYPTNGSPAGLPSWTEFHSRSVSSGSGDPLKMYGNPFYTRTAFSYIHPTLPNFAYRRRAQIFYEFNGSALSVTEANGLAFSQFFASWTRPVPLDQVLGSWERDGWFVRLIPQSEPGRDDLFRVCWHVRLPDVEIVGFVNGSQQVLVPAGPPVLRVSCSIHRKQDGGDVGGRVLDDVDGQDGGEVVTYNGAW